MSIKNEIDSINKLIEINCKYEEEIQEFLNEIMDRYKKETGYDIECIDINLFDVNILNRKIVYQAGEFVADNNMEKALLKHDKIKKKVVKLKYQMNRKRKPYNVLKYYFDQHIKDSITHLGQTDFMAIMEESKLWIKESK